MMGYFECFQFYIAFPTPRSVSGINGSLLAYGIGTVVLLDENDNIHELQKVMFVPGLNDLIISKYWTKRQGLTISLDKDKKSHYLPNPVSVAPPHPHNGFQPSPQPAGLSTIQTTTKSLPSLMNFQLPTNGIHLHATSFD
jgi:hypothetical protein